MKRDGCFPAAAEREIDAAPRRGKGTQHEQSRGGCEVRQGGAASDHKLPTTHYEYDVYGRPTVTKQFKTPVFYQGACTFHQDRQMTLVVEPAPWQWWWGDE